MSRRMFLQGSGGLMFAIPLLESLAPSKASAQSSAPPCRYIQIMSQHNVPAHHYWGLAPDGSTYNSFNGFGAATQVSRSQLNPAFLGYAPADIEKNIRAMSLSAKPAGPLSRILGARISALRDKFSLIRGMDLQDPIDIRHERHQFLFATTASLLGNLDREYLSPPLAGHNSVDVVLKNSSIVYPAGFPTARKLISLSPGAPEQTTSYSWENNAATPLLSQTQALFDLFSTGWNQAQPAPANRQVDVTGAVLDDYKRVRDGTKISTADRSRLTAYMDLIADIQRGLLNIPAPGAICQAPAIGSDGTLEAQYQNQFRVIAAAMACGLSRVANIYMPFIDDVGDMHGISHRLDGSLAGPSPDKETAESYLNQLTRFSDRIAVLMESLNAIQESNGTVLDNSIVYWSMGHGHPYGHGGGHEVTDFPVFVGGGGGGKLTQGQFIDFRLQNLNPLGWWQQIRDASGNVAAPGMPMRGLPLNNLLVTFMNCMGLSSSNYERTGEAGQGFGYYSPRPENPKFAGQIRLPHEDFWRSTQGRQSPLPYFYKGQLLG